jgi:serine/threonine protein kinase/tetratricopeptide (TPR) repeat protein
MSRIETILAAAVEIAAVAERQEFVNHACAGDRELQNQVEQLIENHFRAGDFLECPAAALVATADEATVIECPGSFIGPYKLLEQIGEGGFGVVFMAEQQEPIRRKVALKILKPGMDSKQVIARFDAERQALALMDHPNIAKVLEAGQTSSARPYFVMDLVRGVPITEQCDQSNLTIRQRLELFIDVCQAVQHAHQKGIIHRDIKPSNVLVTLHDGKAVVKVIDFGVAKAMGQQLTEKTLFTNFAQMIGTPLYMSPEQAEMSGLDVDTRSDIYSLGVLLYELLTGTTPFDRERLKQAGFDEIRRIIREEEPPRPSTRISTLGMMATTLSNQRKSDPRRLIQLFRGELDWIVMKCLEKDRNRRYESASALAVDVRRYLSDEPVLACPPSPVYRFRKFARRNKPALAAATVVGLLLVCGVAGLAVSNFLIAQKEQEAVRQREDARAQRRLARRAVDKMFTQVAEKWLAKRAGLEPLQREFLEDALAFYQDFAKEQSTDPDARLDIALAHNRVARIQGALGDSAQAAAAFDQGIAVLEGLVAEFPSEPRYRSSLAQIYYDYGYVVVYDGRHDDAVEALRHSVRLRKELADEFPDAPLFRMQLALGLDGLATILTWAGHLRESEDTCRDAVALFHQVPEDLANTASCRMSYSGAAYQLGWTLRARGEQQQAEQWFDLAVTLREKLVADYPHDPDFQAELATAMRDWGCCVQGTRPQEAEKALRRAVAISESVVARSPTVGWYLDPLAESCRFLANMLTTTNDPQEAVGLYEKAIECNEKRLVVCPNLEWHRVAIADCRAKLIELLKRLGRPDAVEKVYRSNVAFYEKMAADHPRLPEYEKELATARKDLEDFLNDRKKN